MFDASAVVSAALNPSGVPRRALAVARTTGAIALSKPVYGEIVQVLARPKFARVLTDDRRREILELLSAAAVWVEPADEVRDCRDKKDNRYLELALAAGAAAIISGDEDLLVPESLARNPGALPRRFSRSRATYWSIVGRALIFVILADADRAVLKQPVHSTVSSEQALRRPLQACRDSATRPDVPAARFSEGNRRERM